MTLTPWIFSSNTFDRNDIAKMAWLSDDKLQTFTTLGGQMVVLYHKNDQTNESNVNVSNASWAG